MVRATIVLAVFLMLSALFLVTTRFQSRQLYMQSDRLLDRARQLDTDWRRLQLERAELTRHARIDGIARNELGMISGAPDRTIYVRSQDLAAHAQGGVATAQAGGRP